MRNVAASDNLLTIKQREELRLSQRVLKKELNEAERALARMRERYLATFLPALVTYLDQEFEGHENEKYGGVVGRFDVAQAFTNTGITMDFRLAEQLLAFACKKRKAYLVADSGQGHDAYYGSKAQYDKYQKIQ